MPGVNFTGGRRNAARQRSRDLTGQKQRDHFQKQRHLAYLKIESPNPVRAGAESRGPHGIRLAHAQQALCRMPTQDESNHANVQIFAIPAAHGILPTSPQPTSGQKRPLAGLEQNSSVADETFEQIRRRLVASHDLVGLRNRTFKESISSSTLVPSSAEQERQTHVKLEELDLPCGPCSSSSDSGQDMDLDLDLRRAPFCFESTTPNVCTATGLVDSDSTVLADPWISLRQKSSITIPLPSLGGLLLRDPTYPPPGGFDIPERAGLDFRLTLPPVTPDNLLVSPAANAFAVSESTLCSPAGVPSRIAESSATPEPPPTAVPLHAELVCPRTPLRQRALVLSPFPHRAYTSSDGDGSHEDTKAATASDPLTYWLCNDDDILETALAPAVVPVTRETVLRDTFVASRPKSATRKGHVPMAGTSESHRTLYQSSAPASIPSSSPLPGTTSRPAAAMCMPIGPVLAGARPVTAPSDCPLFSATDRSFIRQELGLGPIDDVGPLVLPLRAETRCPNSPSIHQTLDSIIASTFPKPRTLAASSVATASAHDAAVLPFPALSRSERGSSEKDTSLADKRAVRRRADVELKFSSFWDEDEDED